MIREAVILLFAGAVLAGLSIWVAGVDDFDQLGVALDAQVPVESWESFEPRDDLLVVDGRKNTRGGPVGAMHLPFERRLVEPYQLPATRQITTVLVVMEPGRAAEARALAQWCGREWAVPRVATLRGGWEK